ncbi:hypothetical protein SA58113_p20053 (plasmid) [Staphylococcus argenteus]|nr:hypothetical protein SA58113_p20053 [Staphylococcus argenteus]
MMIYWYQQIKEVETSRLIMINRGVNMETYKQLKERHQKEFNDLPLFFAFNDEQFEKGLAKVNATKDTKIVRLNAGCYIKKSDVEKLNSLLKQHEKEHLYNMTISDDYIYHMMMYELANREFVYSRDLNEVLNECIPDKAIDEVPHLHIIIDKAVKDYIEKVG